MNLKDKAALVLGTTVLISGTLWMLEPGKTRESIDENLRQQQVEQLSDSQERVQDRYRDEGRDAMNAEIARRNGTHATADPDARPRIRIRP